MKNSKTCRCTSKTTGACANCSRLRMVFLMSFELGNIKNPVYYSFQHEERKYKSNEIIVGMMLQRLTKFHRGRFYKIEVYDNQIEGKPKLFEFKK